MQRNIKDLAEAFSFDLFDVGPGIPDFLLDHERVPFKQNVTAWVVRNRLGQLSGRQNGTLCRGALRSFTLRRCVPGAFSHAHFLALNQNRLSKL